MQGAEFRGMTLTLTLMADWRSLMAWGMKLSLSLVDTLYGAPVEENPGIHFEHLQPAEGQEPLSGCLCDGVCVVSPGQVVTDVDPKEPEAADSLLMKRGACSSPCRFL